MSALEQGISLFLAAIAALSPAKPTKAVPNPAHCPKAKIERQIEVIKKEWPDGMQTVTAIALAKEVCHWHKR